MENIFEIFEGIIDTGTVDRNGDCISPEAMMHMEGNVRVLDEIDIREAVLTESPADSHLTPIEWLEPTKPSVARLV